MTMFASRRVLSAPFGWRRISAALAIAVALAPLLTSAVLAQSLTVALYPYVPRIGQFETAIRAEWAKVQPGIQLNFINDLKVWDGGYDTDPPPQADIYVFDTMYFNDFHARGLLVAMASSEIQNAGDFLPYARDAVSDSGIYSAIPQLGCANILFYNVNDTAVANATTLGQLQSTLNQCTYTSEIPPDRRGLMLDMDGRTTNASLYLDIAHSMNGTYPLPLPSTPDASVVADQQLMLTLASFWNAVSQNQTPYVRGDWFSGGYGRAMMGFTEAMSVMSPTTLANIGFKVMPLSNTAGNQPLFYVDAIGVNTTTIQRGTRDLAVQLANVIAATDTIVASFSAPQAGANPQYLMSVRDSAFKALGQQYPIYQRMHQLALSSNPVAFKLDATGRNWVKSTSATIRKDVRSNYPCGCDETPPRPIFSNADAQSVCPAVCGTNGGWSGQWTNQSPAPGSVCGCNACPIK
jgi:thiamine pyridinylase